jgi:hypothetical protein
VREEVDKEHQESHWGTLRDGSGEEWECPQSGYLEMGVTMEERRPMLSQVGREDRETETETETETERWTV